MHPTVKAFAMARFTPGAGAEKIQPMVKTTARSALALRRVQGVEKIHPIVKTTARSALYTGCKVRKDSPDRKDAFVIPDARPAPSLPRDALLFG